MNRAAKRLAEGAAFDGRTVHIESQPGALSDFEPLAASSKSSNSDCGLTSSRWLSLFSIFGCGAGKSGAMSRYLDEISGNSVANIREDDGNP